MDKTQYPLVVLKDTKRLFKEIEHIININFDIIESYESQSVTAISSYKAINQGEFYFHVLEPNYKPEYISYRVRFCPTDETNNLASTHHLSKDEIVLKFQEWTAIIKEYDSFSFSDEETITKQYEDEFFADFEIIDDDADEKAFESEKQILLYNWLSLLEHDLKSNKSLGQDNPLAKETADLKDNIQNLTKRQFVIRFAKLMSKVKKTGLKLLYDVFDVAKKEALKKLLYGGIEGIVDMAQHIHLL